MSVPVSSIGRLDGTIVFVLPHLRAGGAETAMIRIANGLAARGHSVALVVLEFAGVLGSEIGPDVEVHQLDVTRVRYGLVPLIRELRRISPTAVISTLNRVNVLVLLAKPWLRGAALYIREASTPSVDFLTGGHSVFLRALAPLIYRFADRVVCLSEAMIVDVANTFNVAADKLVKIPNPAPITAITKALEGATSPYPKEQRAIVYCGRLTDLKGVDILIEAMVSVVQAVPEAHLHIVGEGADKDKYESQVLNLDLGERVSFHGFRSDRYRFLKYASLGVFPSRWEGLPNVVLETLACDTPVVATDCPGGIREIIRHGANGWLVTPDAPEELAGIVSDVLLGRLRCTAKGLCESLGDFDEQRVLDSYEMLIKEVRRIG